MHISFGKGFLDTHPKGKDFASHLEFFAFVKGMKRHHGKLSFKEYASAPKQERGRDKDGPWFIPARFVRPERRADAVALLTGFVGDFDSGRVTRKRLEEVLQDPVFGGCDYIAWTSYSHGVERKERWRLFIPYGRPINTGEHRPIFELFQGKFEGELDARCETVSQLWYLPGCPLDAEPLGRVIARETGTLFEYSGFDRGAHDVTIGGQPANSVRALVAATAQRDPNEDLIGPKRKPTFEEIRAMLIALPVEDYADYTKWLNLAMSVWDATDGSQEGLELFDEWSQTVPNYGGPDTTRAKWRSFGGRSSGNRITVATLIKQAVDAGFADAAPDVSQRSSGPSAGALPPPAVSQPAPAPNNVVQTLVASAVAVPALTAVTPPPNWRANPKQCTMQRLAKDPETGNEQWVTMIRGLQLLRVELLEALDIPDGLVEMEFRNPDKTRTVRIGAGTAAGGKLTDLRAALAEACVIMQADEMKNLQELIVDWLKKVQEHSRVKKAFSHLGWIEKDGKHMGFAAGTSAYYPDGTEEADVQSTARATSIIPAYKPMGSIAPWKQVTDFLVKQNRPELMTILSTAFASPLVKFSGVSGAVVSIVSTASGVGKSSTLAMAQSVWGDPKAAMHAASDTPLSLSKKMGFTKHLPAYWDDIKGERTFEQFSELLFQITQGKEKSRLDQQANLRPIETWDCLAVVAANDSLVEVAKRYSNGSDAGVARIFEIRLEDRPLGDIMPASFFDQCRANYGHAGAIYARWLSQNKDAVEKAVVSTTERLSNELKMTSEERFWIAIMSTLLVGAKCARLCGLVDFDVPALEAFLKEKFEAQRGGKKVAVQDNGPAALVGNLIYDHQTETLVISGVGPGKPAQVISTPKSGEVSILLIQQGAILRIRKAKFRDWCRDKNIWPENLVMALQRRRAIAVKHADPAAGVAGYTRSMRTTCYDIDLAALGLEGELDDRSET